MSSLCYLPTLPVLSEVFSFLLDVNVMDTCHFASTCKTVHDFFTTDKGMHLFWSKMILRTAHHKYTGVDFMSLMECYPTQIYPATYFFIEGLENVRRIMGECQNKSHLDSKKNQATTYTYWRHTVEEGQRAKNV